MKVDKNSYVVQKGIIYSEGGLPYEPRWFCDGRMAFEADNQGIRQLDYFGAESSGNYMIFKKRFWDGIRLFLNKQGVRSALRPRKCQIMPFGFRSESEVCNYGIYTVGDCLFVVVHPAFDCVLDMEFYDDTVFRPETHEYSGVGLGGPKREWKEFHMEDGELKASFSENGVETYLAFSSNASLLFRQTPKNTKYTLTMEALKAGEEYVLALSISNGKTKTYNGYQELIKKQFARYEKVAERMPVLQSPHPKLNQFFELAPMYHESLKTTDVAGAMRAQSTHYWVWGWDSMTSNQACFYWGDTEFMGQMLDCFESHAHPEYGIAHAFNHKMEMSGDTAAPPPAQGMYITMLDMYRQAGGAYQKHYAFAKKLIETIFATEVRDTGLCIGTSLYPDHRALIRETGNDISTFNNTVSYCAVKSMEQIAKQMGDEEMRARCRQFADRMKSHFETILFNEEIGFIDSSVEADTYEKRNVPSNNAVKWENNYCSDLVQKRTEEYLKFYETYLVSPAGLRPIPENNACYDSDANQLHCWWIVMSEFYTRLINQSDRPDLVNQYIGWVEYWSERLMCPEGIPCYDNDSEVPFDNWNCLCGIWHGYSIRGFYNSIVHAYVGVDFDENGMNFYPYSGEEVTLYNLHWGEKTFDVFMKGSGTSVETVHLNGKNLGSVRSIPYHILEKHNRIEVVRK